MRKEHARERREKDTRSPRKPRIWSAWEQSYTIRSDITRRFRWKSKSRHTKNETSSHLRPQSLRALPSLNIFSIDRTLQTPKPWVAPVCYWMPFREPRSSWSATNFDAVKNKRNEKAAKFSVPLPKVRGIAEEEMFKVVKTGKKTAKKGTILCRTMEKE